MKSSFKKLFNLLLLTSKKGFTLIELLVVIAVIGVLAAIVLLAINPVEQLARGRDANRISAVEGLGKSMSNYVTSNNSVIPVVDGTATPGTWQNVLTASKDITNVVSLPDITGGTPCAGGTLTSDVQVNICYAVDSATPTKFAIWTTVESNNELLKATGTGTPCSKSQGIVYFDSSKGLVQVACMSAVGAGTNPVSGTMSEGPFTP